MLPAAYRLTDGEGFRTAVRTGHRVSGATLVVHLRLPGDPAPDRAHGVPPRAGFVVSRAVGNAVTRNRVQRRLRHLVRPLLANLPAGSVLVVRAMPAAATASGAELSADLERCVARAATRGKAPTAGQGAS